MGCLVFVPVVGIEVEVVADLHRSIRKNLDELPLKERVSREFECFEVKLIGEILTNSVIVR
ncbi:hypothetical protein HKK80_14835 [Halonotius sp. F2-221B]